MDTDDKVILTGLGIALLIFLLLIPKLRQAYLNSKRPLAERYADDLSAGRAIIIPANPSNKIKAVIQVVALGTAFLLLRRQLHLYIAHMEQTCAGFYGWNSVFFVFGSYFTMVYIVFAWMFIIILRRHRQVFRDGYAPLWPYDTNKAHIAFKLTPKIKLKWHLQLGFTTIVLIYCLLAPFFMLHASRFTLDHTLPQQLHTFNDRLQADCRKDLHQQSLNPTSPPTPSPATSPPNPATDSTHP